MFVSPLRATPTTPLSLYKYLLRKCKILPTEDAQKYYRHFIRQSFNQHSDETDQERVHQIISQAVKDIEWVLKKSEMENPTDELLKTDFPRSPVDETPLSFKECLHSRRSFYSALSIFVSKPRIFTKKWKATKIRKAFFLSDSLRSLEILQIQKHLAKSAFPEVTSQQKLLLDNLTKSIEDGDFNSIDDLHQACYIERDYIGLESSCPSFELWDFKSDEVTIETNARCNTICFPISSQPVFKFVARILSSCNEMEICLSPKIQNSSLLTTTKLYAEKIVPKIFQWASGSVLNAKKLSLACVPNDSHVLISDELYLTTYQRCKSQYAGLLKQMWTEATDPEKFIHEDVAIASYLYTFWKENGFLNSDNVAIKFIDFGCGNGVLTFLLTQLGVQGYGFDIRKRKIWGPLSDKNSDLRVHNFNPHTDDYQGDENTWFIGNHADELTPWIPLLARKSRSNFLLIPCCPYDFFGKCQKKSYSELQIQVGKHLSSFENYIAYVTQVARKCGYDTMVDKIKIPSTKRIAIVGTSMSLGSSSVGVEEVNEYISSKLLREQSKDAKSVQVEFQSRSPHERVNNCTKVSHEIIKSIVEKIFSKLLSEKHMIKTEGYVTEWNAGKQNLRLKDIMDLLSPEEKRVLKSQGNGIQTLVKNHKYIFHISKGCVNLRHPCGRKDSGLGLATEKVKSRPCYFFRNHPDGCPLDAVVCSFKH